MKKHLLLILTAVMLAASVPWTAQAGVNIGVSFEFRISTATTQGDLEPN